MLATLSWPARCGASGPSSANDQEPIMHTTICNVRLPGGLTI